MVMALPTRMWCAGAEAAPWASTDTGKPFRTGENSSGLMASPIESDGDHFGTDGFRCPRCPWRADLPVQYITSDRFEKLMGLYSRMSVDTVGVLTTRSFPAFIILVLVEHRSGLTEAQKRLAQFRTDGARSASCSWAMCNSCTD